MAGQWASQMPGVKTKVPTQGGKRSLGGQTDGLGRKSPKPAQEYGGHGSTVCSAVPHKRKQGASPGPDLAASPQLEDGVGTPEDEAHRPGFKAQLHPELGHRCPSASVFSASQFDCWKMGLSLAHRAPNV